jgi:type IV secretory pathway TrbF-like protein
MVHQSHLQRTGRCDKAANSYRLGNMMGTKLATAIYGVVVHGVAKSDVNPTTNESDSIGKSIKDLETKGCTEPITSKCAQCDGPHHAWHEQL